ncbi:INO80 complex subunit C-like protein [Cricetulus griseus]|nr:INO80 complex subunit C-like protein [Cricetulus griseus]
MAAQIPIVAATSTPTIARNSKKRPASPSHNGSGGGYGASKKKKLSGSGFAQGVSIEAMSENKMASSEFGSGPVEKAAKPLPFKDPNFVHSGHGGAVAGKKNRTWKNLKQILAAERALPWQLNDPNYFSIDAPPSFKPAKKYSDVSGLLANYTDPQSKLRFSTIEEFSYIRRLPSDVVTGYLALRKATSIDHCAPGCDQHIVTPQLKHTSAPPLPTQDITYTNRYVPVIPDLSKTYHEGVLDFVKGFYSI